MKMMRPPSTEAMDEALRNAPMWVCPRCGEVYQKLPSPRWVMMGGRLSYVAGRCTECEARDEARKKRLKKLQEARELIQASRLPKRFVSESELMVTDAELWSVLDNVENDGRWVHLYGTNSTGKSTQMARTIRRLVAKGVRCYYINEVEFFGAVKSSWDVPNRSENELLDKLKQAEVLFWDEFCWYALQSGWKADIVYNLLEYFETNDKLIVFAGTTPARLLPNKLNKDHLHRLKRKKIRCLEMKNKPFY